MARYYHTPCLRPVLYCQTQVRDIIIPPVSGQSYTVRHRSGILSYPLSQASLILSDSGQGYYHTPCLRPVLYCQTQVRDIIIPPVSGQSYTVRLRSGILSYPLSQASLILICQTQVRDIIIPPVSGQSYTYMSDTGQGYYHTPCLRPVLYCQTQVRDIIIPPVSGQSYTVRHRSGILSYPLSQASLILSDSGQGYHHTPCLRPVLYCQTQVRDIIIPPVSGQSYTVRHRSGILSYPLSQASLILSDTGQGYHHTPCLRPVLYCQTQVRDIIIPPVSGQSYTVRLRSGILSYPLSQASLILSDTGQGYYHTPCLRPVLYCQTQVRDIIIPPVSGQSYTVRHRSGILPYPLSQASLILSDTGQGYYHTPCLRPVLYLYVRHRSGILSYPLSQASLILSDTGQGYYHTPCLRPVLYCQTQVRDIIIPPVSGQSYTVRLRSGILSYPLSQASLILSDTGQGYYHTPCLRPVLYCQTQVRDLIIPPVSGQSYTVRLRSGILSYPLSQASLILSDTGQGYYHTPCLRPVLYCQTQVRDIIIPPVSGQSYTVRHRSGILSYPLSQASLILSDTGQGYYHTPCLRPVLYCQTQVRDLIIPPVSGQSYTVRHRSGILSYPLSQASLILSDTGQGYYHTPCLRPVLYCQTQVRDIIIPPVSGQSYTVRLRSGILSYPLSQASLILICQTQVRDIIIPPVSGQSYTYMSDTGQGYYHTPCLRPVLYCQTQVRDIIIPPVSGQSYTVRLRSGILSYPLSQASLILSDSGMILSYSLSQASLILSDTGQGYYHTPCLRPVLYCQTQVRDIIIPPVSGQSYTVRLRSGILSYPPSQASLILSDTGQGYYHTPCLRPVLYCQTQVRDIIIPPVSGQSYTVRHRSGILSYPPSQASLILSDSGQGYYHTPCLRPVLYCQTQVRDIIIPPVSGQSYTVRLRSGILSYPLSQASLILSDSGQGYYHTPCLRPVLYCQTQVRDITIPPVSGQSYTVRHRSGILSYPLSQASLILICQTQVRDITIPPVSGQSYTYMSDTGQGYYHTPCLRPVLYCQTQVRDIIIPPVSGQSYTVRLRSGILSYPLSQASLILICQTQVRDIIIPPVSGQSYTVRHRSGILSYPLSQASLILICQTQVRDIIIPPVSGQSYTVRHRSGILSYPLSQASLILICQTQVRDITIPPLSGQSYTVRHRSGILSYPLSQASLILSDTGQGYYHTPCLRPVLYCQTQVRDIIILPVSGQSYTVRHRSGILSYPLSQASLILSDSGQGYYHTPCLRPVLYCQTQVRDIIIPPVSGQSYTVRHRSGILSYPLSQASLILSDTGQGYYHTPCLRPVLYLYVRLRSGILSYPLSQASLILICQTQVRDIIILPVSGQSYTVRLRSGILSYPLSQASLILSDTGQGYYHTPCLRPVLYCQTQVRDIIIPPVSGQSYTVRHRSGILSYPLSQASLILSDTGQGYYHTPCLRPVLYCQTQVRDIIIPPVSGQSYTVRHRSGILSYPLSQASLILSDSGQGYYHTPCLRPVLYLYVRHRSGILSYPLSQASLILICQTQVRDIIIPPVSGQSYTVRHRYGILSYSLSQASLILVTFKLLQGTHCTGKTENRENVKENTGNFEILPKHREFYLNTGKTQGILLGQVVNVLILKVKDIAIVAAKVAIFFSRSWIGLPSQFCVCNSHKLCKLAQGKFVVRQGKHREFENTI